MALRVTQGMMYSSFVSQMNMNLSAFMESNIQASSQKKVNRPSDDPVSAGRILSTRADLSKLAVYEENIEQAMGWLNLADTTLAGTDGSVQSILSTLQGLAQQGASGTYDNSNREQIAMQARQLFEQLITLANTTFEGRHIFAGHKVDGLAYEQALGVSVKGIAPGSAAVDAAGDPVVGLNAKDIHVTGGDINSTTIFRAVGPGAAGDVMQTQDAEFEYWDASAKEWKAATATYDNVTDILTLEGGNGTKMEIACSGTDANGTTVPTAVTIADKENDHYNDNGTWLYVRPTAVYKGDDNYSEVSTAYLPSTGNFSDHIDPSLPNPIRISGNFTKDTIVRIDEMNWDVIKYSYSVDDGSTWIDATTPRDPSGTDPSTAENSFNVPGGTLFLNNAALVDGNNTGAQFVIHPHRADINFQISEDSHITVNMVGANIFGGMYDYQGDGRDYPVVLDNPKPEENLFEVVGDLVGALETGNQQGCQEVLDKLKPVMDLVLTRAAEIGGRENRLISQQANTIMRSYAEQDNLSFMEDVDFTELMTKLSQQQIAYNSVLKSSSMIMQMSLVNFL